MIPVTQLSRTDDLFRYSNPKSALLNLRRYLNDDNVLLYKSTNKNKKYMVISPTGHKVHFGQIGYEDFTKHGDTQRRENYLRRTENIRGD